VAAGADCKIIRTTSLDMVVPHPAEVAEKIHNDRRELVEGRSKPPTVAGQNAT
jgi:hypothetical protein